MDAHCSGGWLQDKRNVVTNAFFHDTVGPAFSSKMVSFGEDKICCSHPGDGRIGRIRCRTEEKEKQKGECGTEKPGQT